MSDLVAQLTTIRTRLRALAWACEWDAGGGWSTGRYTEIHSDMVEAIRALGRAGGGYPTAEEPDLRPLELLAGLRTVRDEIEALILADMEPKAGTDIASAGFALARAVIMLARTIAREARQDATIRALHAGAASPIGRAIAAPGIGR